MDGINTLPAVALRADLVVNEIRSAILRGDLRQGTPLSERAIAEKLGVSKTPVREAMQRLVTSGLVTSTPYHKHVVRTFDEAHLKDLEYVRLRLEPHAVRHAVGNPEVIAEAQRAHERALTAIENDDPVSVNDANRDFHRVLYSAAGNDLLSKILDDLRDQTAIASMVAWKRANIRDELQKEHLSILKSITTGDPDGAERKMTKHIMNSLRAIARQSD